MPPNKPLKTSDFDYYLPPECIAQTPLEPRHDARLLVFNRQTGEVQHKRFYNLGDFLQPGDVLVLNETRVIRARLFARKIPGGGKVELLLLKKRKDNIWECLVGGKKVVPGKRLELEENIQAEVISILDGPRRLVRFSQPIDKHLEEIGHVPLPPYIHTELKSPERYQTVYAIQPGSAAAPTAGLHFTKELMQSLENRGILFCKLTLHVGLDTFAPVNEDRPEDHRIHTEWCQLPAETANTILNARQKGGRVVAVGTTSVRTLETAAVHSSKGEIISPFEGPTDLFIYPGYSFRIVDAMITNFHLPKSTLIMLVSAFAGREKILELYQLAIEKGYRFYSFGDAMLIL